jgi:phospholipid/cholesterol/gamma-HCH transport system substrate-binding protein
MPDRNVEFRVGLFVIVSMTAMVGLILRFENMTWLWDKGYTLVVRFQEAPGVGVGTPVRNSGLSIGSVKQVFLDEEKGGVTVIIDVRSKTRIRKDSRPRLSRTILGDASIDFTPGTSKEIFAANSVIEGIQPVDPIELIARMESQVRRTLSSFADTSDEWRKVGANINSLVEANEGEFQVIVQRAADSLQEFTAAIKNINAVVGNRNNQHHLEQALAAVPEMISETRDTIATTKKAIHKIDENLANILNVTGPLARRSTHIIMNLDKGVANLEELLSEVNLVARRLNQPDSTFSMLINDPSLYKNLDDTASTLNLLLEKLIPIMDDFRVFADKVSRDPGLLGVRGMVSPSAGIKTASGAEADIRESPTQRSNRQTTRGP